MSRNPTPGRRPAFRRPTVLIGSDTNFLGHPTVAPAQAALAGIYGIDLDLRRTWRPPDSRELDHIGTARVRSVWLPAQYSGLLADQRASRLCDFLTHAATHNGLRTLVLPTLAPTRPQGASIAQMARRVAAEHPVHIALAINAGDVLARPGNHLNHVANIRRFAEEWDVVIALDLSAGSLDTWEAEAALMRLFPRLGLVRIAPVVGPDGTHPPTALAAIAARTLAMLADQAYGNLLTVTPGPRSSPWLAWAPRPNLDLAVATRQEILDTYTRIDQYTISHHESNPRS